MIIQKGSLVPFWDNCFSRIGSRIDFQYFNGNTSNPHFLSPSKVNDK
jgi:hypothetical protein